MSVNGRLKLGGLHPHFRSYVDLLLDIADHLGIGAVITSATRTADEQRHLCAQLLERSKRTGEKLPCAAPGLSAHNYGLAVDIVFGPNLASREHAIMVQVAQAIGLGRVSDDPPHFEHPAWRTILPVVRARLGR